jgi:nicotinamide riboside transporter PnuC
MKTAEGQRLVDNALGILSLLANVAGSLLIASNTGNIVLGYAFFIAGVFPATYLLIKSNANKTLLLTNLYFFGVNIFGIFRHWGG